MNSRPPTKFFGNDRLPVAPGGLGGQLPQLGLRLDHARLEDSLGASLGHRLHDRRKGEILGQPFATRREQHEGRCEKACLPYHPFCQALVECKGQGRRIRTCVGYAHQLEERRDLGFPMTASEPLGDVEHEIDLRRGQQGGQLRGRLEFDHAVAVRLDRLPDRSDRLG